MSIAAHLPGLKMAIFKWKFAWVGPSGRPKPTPPPMRGMPVMGKNSTAQGTPGWLKQQRAQLMACQLGGGMGGAVRDRVGFGCPMAEVRDACLRRPAAPPALRRRLFLPQRAAGEGCSEIEAAAPGQGFQSSLQTFGELWQSPGSLRKAQ